MILQRPGAGSAFGGVVAVLSLIVPLRSQADITIVSNVTVSGQFMPTRHEGARTVIPYPIGTVSTYYHGDMARIEASGSVTIFDSDKDRVTILDPSAKTYVVLPLKKTLAEVNPPAERALAGHVESTVSAVTDVNAVPKPNKKTIVDRSASMVSVDASADLTEDSPLTSGAPGRGLGRGGRGGYGRGGGPTGGRQTPPPGSTGGRVILPTYQIEGEYWMSGEITALTTGVKNRKLLLLPSYLETLAIAPLFQHLFDR